MRFFCFAYSLYFLFLAILPAVYHSNDREGMNAKCGKSVCCKKKSNPRKADSEKKGSDNNCTPLFGCTKIQLIINKVEQVNIRTVSVEVFYPYFTENFSNTFSSNTWHPPRIS